MTTVICLLVVACSGNPLQQESELEKLRTADMSPRYPERVKQAGSEKRDPGALSGEELYPGNITTASINRGGAKGVAKGGEAASVRKSSDGAHQLNVENASVIEVAKVVLGDTLQMSYVIDPRVQGTITVSTARSVSREELLSVFETALRIVNAVLISGPTGYRIVPVSEAIAGDSGVLSPVRASEAATPGFGISMLPLRYVSAESMMRLLEGFLAKAGTTRADTLGNILLMRGTAQERQRIAEIAATFDVDWLRGQSAGIFPLSNAVPDEIINELNQVIQAEAGDTAKLIRVQAIARLNALLVLTKTSDQLRTVAEWIKRLDRTSTTGQNLTVYQVENGKASEMAALLMDTFGNGGGTRRSAKSEIAPGREPVTIANIPQKAVNGQPQIQQQVVSPQGAAPRPAAPIIEGGNAPTGTGGGTADVRIIADESANRLLIRANPTETRRILNALRQIDRPPLQVLINATIAEVTLNDSLRYGVQAYLRSSDVGLASDKGSGGYQAGPTEIKLLPSFPGLNFILGSKNDPRMILDALSGVTSVKVVSSPSLVVVDNQPAVLKVGDEVPISTQQVQSLQNPDAPLVNSIRFRETGVILRVIPRVNSSGLVTMEIEQEISQVADNNNATSLTPTISQRRVASTIAVYSGQTVVLGGLISEQENREKQGVPIVNRIPVIGDLVGKTTRSDKRTELIVFIKPDVIRNSEDASKMTEELRSQLRSMAQPPDLGREGRWQTEYNRIKQGQPARQP